MPEIPYPPRPSPRPNPLPRGVRKAAEQAAARMPGWGWVEWFIISQTALAAALFIPGVSAVRPIVRISSYVMGLIAWAGILYQGRSSAAAAKFPARPWLGFCMIWLGLSIGHPYIYSLPAAVGQVMLYITVLSPAFWAGEAIDSPRQLRRVMAILLAVNALSASIGFAQVYSNRFNPPEIPAANNQFGGDDLRIEVNGRRIFRPCGLSDSPGSAAPAGAVTALIGLCFALRPGGLLKRAACVGFAFIGIAVIYFSQVRSTLVVLAICFIVLTTLLVLQGRTANALTLAGGSIAMLAGVFLWVMRRMSTTRFELLGSDPLKVYRSQREGYVIETFTRTIWEHPLGHGMGWWGQIHGIFFNPARLSPVWVEVMIPAWVVDGGIPLLVGYCGAITVTVYNSIRIALTNNDPEVAFWAAVVVAQNISTVALCFSYITFLAPPGLQFWMLNAVIHVADAMSKKASPGSASPRPRRVLPRAWYTPPGPRLAGE